MSVLDQISMSMELRVDLKRNFIWNMIGSTCEAIMSLFALVIVNRVMGETAGGVFSFAFSHAQLMYYIGTLEVRPIQSTDVKDHYSFASYFSLRLISSAIMILVCIVYACFMDADPIKKRIIMYMCLYKCTESILDVFTSLYQQRGQIHYSGKISVIRVGIGLTAFTGVLVFFRNLEVACLMLVASGVFTLFSYNIVVWKRMPNAEIRFTGKDLLSIALDSIPLFISMAVMLYVGNAPKYAIDLYCTDVIQNRYGILFMPATAVILLSQFMIRPLLTPMAVLWSDHKKEEFRNKAIKQLLAIVLITFFGVAAAWLLGIPVLQLMYGVNLQADKSVLLLVMVYGGLNAFSLFLYSMIALMGAQKWLLIGYIIAAIAVFVFSPVLVRHYEMLGGVAASIIAMVLLDLVLQFIMIHAMKNDTGSKNEERYR